MSKLTMALDAYAGAVLTHDQVSIWETRQAMKKARKRVIKLAKKNKVAKDT